MAKRNTKKVEVKKGSRLKLKNGNWARVEIDRILGGLLPVTEYVKGDKQFRGIPVGHIQEVVRY